MAGRSKRLCVVVGECCLILLLLGLNRSMLQALLTTSVFILHMHSSCAVPCRAVLSLLAVAESAQNTTLSDRLLACLWPCCCWLCVYIIRLRPQCQLLQQHNNKTTGTSGSHRRLAGGLVAFTSCSSRVLRLRLPSSGCSSWGCTTQHSKAQLTICRCVRVVCIVGCEI